MIIYMYYTNITVYVSTSSYHCLQKRRLYNCSAPGALWHADGNDKLKRYGFAIHGAIDGYSRKLMWLKVCNIGYFPELFFTVI